MADNGVDTDNDINGTTSSVTSVHALAKMMMMMMMDVTRSESRDRNDGRR